ncbi:MAG: hypothetical protein KDD70_03410 [Bdellovibrionales bacterium]|nr:hypothetical protein [Bdellovibrionales bacterium]
MEAEEFLLYLERERKAAQSRAEGNEENRQPSRVTKQYNHQELEQVLSTPAGPYRIPPTATATDEFHVKRLQYVLAKEGAKHEKQALRGNRYFGSWVLPVVCGVFLGFSVASAVLLLWT